VLANILLRIPKEHAKDQKGKTIRTKEVSPKVEVREVFWALFRLGLSSNRSTEERLFRWPNPSFKANTKAAGLLEADRDFEGKTELAFARHSAARDQGG